MTHEEALEWLNGNRSTINVIPPEPHDTWQWEMEARIEAVRSLVTAPPFVAFVEADIPGLGSEVVNYLDGGIGPYRPTADTDDNDG